MRVQSFPLLLIERTGSVFTLGTRMSYPEGSGRRGANCEISLRFPAFRAVTVDG